MNARSDKMNIKMTALLLALALLIVPTSMFAGKLDNPAVSGVSAINNATENELITVGAVLTELESESLLTFDGTELLVNANQEVTGDLETGGRTAFGVGLSPIVIHGFGGVFSDKLAGVNIQPTMTPIIGVDLYPVNIAPGITEAASGTHPLITVLRVVGPTVTAGGAAVTEISSLELIGGVAASGTTDTATLRIQNAWSGGSGDNLAFHIKVGDAIIEDNLALGAVEPGAAVEGQNVDLNVAGNIGAGGMLIRGSSGTATFRKSGGAIAISAGGSQLLVATNNQVQINTARLLMGHSTDTGTLAGDISLTNGNQYTFLNGAGTSSGNFGIEGSSADHLELHVPGTTDIFEFRFANTNRITIENFNSSAMLEWQNEAVADIIAGAANQTRLYTLDDGGGNTQLKVRFFTGPSLVLAVQGGAMPVPSGGSGAVTFTDNGVLLGSGTGAFSVTAVGTSGQVLTSNGAGLDPTFQTGGGGNVNNTGTPLNNQLAIWTDATTIEGDADLTWDGTTLNVNTTLTVQEGSTFNQSGADADTIIEGDTNPVLFVADAGQDSISIGAFSGLGRAFNVVPGAVSRDLVTSVGMGLHMETDSWSINAAGAGETVAIGTLAFLGQPTWSSVGTTFTVSDAATWYVAGPPVASTNVTLTRAYAAWIDSGDLRVDDQLIVGGAIASSITEPGAGLIITASGPRLSFIDSGQPANDQRWEWIGISSALHLRALTDAGTSTQTAIRVDRTSFTIDNVTIDNGDFIADERVMVATTLTTGSASGDIVLGNLQEILWVNAGGTTSNNFGFRGDAGGNIIAQIPGATDFFQWQFAGGIRMTVRASQNGGVLDFNAGSSDAAQAPTNVARVYSVSDSLRVIFDNASPITLTTAGSAGVVQLTGTPVDNQLGVWTSATTQEGDASLTWDGSLLTVGTGIKGSGVVLEIVGTPGSSVGGFPSGGLHVTSPAALVNSNSVITGHSSFGGNKQLWYLGSVSSGNDNIAFINRQNAALQLNTNNLSRLTILAGGDIGIGLTNPSEKLEVNGNIKVGGTIIQDGATSGFLTYDVPAVVTDYTVTWPAAQASGTQVLQNDGAGALSWATVGGAQITGTPVDNQMAIWTSATNIEGDANLIWDGSTLTATGDLQWNGKKGGAVQVVALAAATFAVTRDTVDLNCAASQSLDTITGGLNGQRLVIFHDDTNCILNNDQAPTAANAIDLSGASNNSGSSAEVVVIVFDGAKGHWLEISSSNN